jgi:hypothetical protein
MLIPCRVTYTAGQSHVLSFHKLLVLAFGDGAVEGGRNYETSRSRS